MCILKVLSMVKRKIYLGENANIAEINTLHALLFGTWVNRMQKETRLSFNL